MTSRLLFIAPFWETCRVRRSGRADGSPPPWRAAVLGEGGCVMLSPAPPRLPHVQLFAFALPALLAVATSAQVAASSLGVFGFAFHP